MNDGKDFRTHSTETEKGVPPRGKKGGRGNTHGTVNSRTNSEGLKPLAGGGKSFPQKFFS